MSITPKNDKFCVLPIPRNEKHGKNVKHYFANLENEKCNPYYLFHTGRFSRTRQFRQVHDKIIDHFVLVCVCCL